MNKRYESEALMVSHQSAESLFRLGVITEDELREFDDMCLVGKSKAEEVEKPATAEHLIA